MRYKTLLALLVTSFSLIGCSTTKGHEGEWVKIATRTVSYNQDTDTIKPLPFLAERNFSKIKIKCIKGAINVSSLIVTMNDGSTKKLNTLGLLSKGMSTFSYSLPGSNKAQLKRLDMEYDSIGSTMLGVVGVSKKGKVEVWGKVRKSE